MNEGLIHIFNSNYKQPNSYSKNMNDLVGDVALEPEDLSNTKDFLQILFRLFQINWVIFCISSCFYSFIKPISSFKLFRSAQAESRSAKNATVFFKNKVLYRNCKFNWFGDKGHYAYRDNSFVYIFTSNRYYPQNIYISKYNLEGRKKPQCIFRREFLQPYLLNNTAEEILKGDPLFGSQVWYINRYKEIINESNKTEPITNRG